MVIIKDFEFSTVEELEIKKEINNHTFCKIKGMIKDENGAGYLKKVNCAFTIYFRQQDEEEVMFSGFILDIVLERVNGNTYLEINAASVSYREDVEKHNRLFQDTKKDYANITGSLGIKDSVPLFTEKSAANRVEEPPLYQCDESNFQFLKRIASKQGLPVIVDDISGDKPYLWLGRRKGRKRKVQTENYAIKRGSSQRAYVLTIGENFDLGDTVQFAEQELFVVKALIFLYDGLLSFQYSLLSQEEIKVKAFYNSSIVGRSLEAQVVSNQDPENRGRIQVEFEIQDSATSNGYWFPYATPYSSKDVGLYFIPEIGDKVIVYFPTEKEEDAVILASIRKESNDLFNQSNVKRIKNAFGKEISIGEKEITITAVDGKVYISLAEDSLNIKNENSFIKLDKDNIIIGTDKAEIRIGKDIEITNNKSSIKLNTDVELSGNTIKLN